MQRDQPIHVLHVGPYPLRKGGISAVTAMLVAEQRGDPGLAVDCLATSVDGGLAAKLVRFSLSLLSLRRRLLRGPRPVLHLHTAHGSSFRRKSAVLRLAARSGAPCIVHVNSGSFATWYDQGSPRLRRSLERGLDRAAAIVGVSRSWQAALSAITSTPVHTIYNGVDVESFRDLRSRERRKGESLRLLFLGGVGLRRKGAFDLLEALAGLARERPERSLRLAVAGVGHPGEAEQLHRAVEQSGLGSSIDLVGWAGPERKRELLQAADVFVLPSYREGLPIAMLESMASRLPVITSPVGGIGEVLQDGTNALLVPPGDVEALARAIRSLDDDADLRRHLARAGLATVTEHFDVRGVASRFRALYRELDSEAATRRASSKRPSAQSVVA